MANDNSFDELLDKIADLLNKLREGKIKSNSDLPLEIDQQIDDLQRNVAFFCQMNENVISQENVQEGEIRKILTEPRDRLPLKEKRLLERIDTLKNDAESYSAEVKLIKKEIQKKENAVGKAGDFGKQRKKKFKSFGGDQKWIPL